VNPEDLELMAYTVLRYARSGDASGEIMPAVEEIIAEHFAATRKMYEAMGETTQARSEGGDAE
jgi:hypothetical protein